MIDINDRMAILDLCASYNYLFDTCAAEEWAATFTADGVFEGPAGRAQGPEALAEFCRNTNAQYPGGMHFTDNHLFEQDGDAVRHKCFLSMQVPSPEGTQTLLLTYEDELRRVDGEWRFASRLCRPLSG